MECPSTFTLKKIYCCNPLNISKHYQKKNLRKVTKNILAKYTFLKKGDKICDACRKKLQSLKPAKSSSSSDEVVSDTSDFPCTPEKDEALEALNQSLLSLSETPIKKKRLIERKYSQEKFQKTVTVIQSKLLNLSSDGEENKSLSLDSEIVKQLKEKFESTNDKSIKMQILTVLPQSWSLERIQSEFGVSNYTARKAKSIVKEKGIMSSPNPKPGKSLEQETVNKVIEFYEDEEISRPMPGKKDFVSTKINGQRQHVQKKLVLSNLQEIYVSFKEKYPGLKIGFSKFCALRPKHCILAGASGTHSVCVCMIHENAKLMMLQCKMPELSKNDKPLNSYKDILKYVTCKDPSDSCNFGKCEKCPGYLELKEEFQEAFEKNCIESVTYKQWTLVEKRISLETFVKPTEEFLNAFFEKLPKLLQHSFITTQQAAYFKHLKNSLKEGEYLVIADFSENYSFLLQDAVQGFHWNNAQATIHPFAVYYKDQTTHTLNYISFVIISDCLTHDTIAVHLFLNHLINFIKAKFDEKLSYIYYYSDGAASQYKNRLNFLNLCLHEVDFKVKAEWHFFATSHGRTSCDGAGGTLKRLASRASLQKVHNDQIMTPRQLYEWANSNIKNMYFQYSTIEDYLKESNRLAERKSISRIIPGTQKLHSFIPLNTKQMQVKAYSFSTISRIENTISNENELYLSEMVGFLTCRYEGHWWLGCVLSTNEDEATVKLKFLHPHGPSPTFAYPNVDDIFCIHKSSILMKVDPMVNPTGRVYSLSKKEIDITNTKL